MMYVRLSILALCLALVGALPAPAQNYDGAPEKPDVVDTAIKAGDFNTLVTALEAADLVRTLKGDGPFTVFAPTDEAFAALPEGTLADLLRPENKAQLQSILKYHVVEGTVRARRLKKQSRLNTLQGANLGIEAREKAVTLSGQNDAAVTKTNIAAGNGVIHVIDAVLMPPEQAATVEE